jgi:hypothetical protein
MRQKSRSGLLGGLREHEEKDAKEELQSVENIGAETDPGVHGVEVTVAVSLFEEENDDDSGGGATEGNKVENSVNRFFRIVLEWKRFESDNRCKLIEIRPISNTVRKIHLKDIIQDRVVERQNACGKYFQTG